jgi:hypothetical protein
MKRSTLFRSRRSIDPSLFTDLDEKRGELLPVPYSNDLKETKELLETAEDSLKPYHSFGNIDGSLASLNPTPKAVKEMIKTVTAQEPSDLDASKNLLTSLPRPTRPTRHSGYVIVHYPTPAPPSSPPTLTPEPANVTNLITDGDMSYSTSEEIGTESSGRRESGDHLHRCWVIISHILAVFCLFVFLLLACCFCMVSTILC